MSERNAKRILFRLSKAPYGSSYAREALDAILAAAAFEQDVSVLFCGNSLYQLLVNQQPELIQHKNFTAAFGLFPLYDLTKIYVEEWALKERALDASQFQIPVTPVTADEICSLLRNQDQIISF